MNCSTAFGDHLFWSRFRCEELYGSRKSTAKMWHESLLPFKMSQDFEALGFSWNHPSKLTWEFCAKIHDLAPPSKRIVPKPDLHCWKSFCFMKKKELVPNQQKNGNDFLYPPFTWCLLFSHPKKKRNGKILGNSRRHKVLHLGYANVVIKVPHISRMWLWWVWKNRRPLEEYLGGMDD